MGRVSSSMSEHSLVSAFLCFGRRGRRREEEAGRDGCELELNPGTNGPLSYDFALQTGFGAQDAALWEDRQPTVP